MGAERGKPSRVEGGAALAAMKWNREYPQVNPWKQVGLDYSKLNFKLLGTKAQYRSVQKGHCPLVLISVCVQSVSVFCARVGKGKAAGFKGERVRFSIWLSSPECEP